MLMARTQSPSFRVLSSNSKRLLMFCEREVVRNGGKPVQLFDDELSIVGSPKIWRTGLAELNALGLIEVVRGVKCHIVKPSSNWRSITSLAEAERASTLARAQGPLPVLV